jgi:ATP-binding cassette, subfamily B, bacterial CvaB/MchF/RaxB
MRVVLQAESSECSLACLAMVANHHGMGLSLRELRRRFPLSLKGGTLRDLINVADRLGLRARPLRLELRQLSRLRLPAVLHWDLNHFVVLKSAGRSRVVIHDPARGRLRMTRAEVSRHFTGVALELAPTAAFQPRPAARPVSLRQLTGRVRGLGRAIALLLLLSLALQVLVVIGPFFLQWTIDQVLVSADADLLTVLALGYTLVLLLQVGVGFLRGWAVVWLSARLGLAWMGNVFAHLVRLPLDFFEKRHLGDVVSRITSVRSIQRTLTTSFVEAVIDGLMSVATLAMMLIYSVKLAAISLAAVTLYLGLRVALFRTVKSGTERQLIAAARQQSHLLETIRGMQSVKVAGTEPQRESAYANLMNDTVNRDVVLARLSLGFTTASGLIFGIERVAVIWVGALLALENVFSVGMLIAWLSYKDQFAARMAALIDKWMELRMLQLHGERLADIALTPPEEAAAPSAEARPPADASLEVRALSFRYAEGEPTVLKCLSFKVAAAESVAIVGASGCGKTTLVKLMLGLLRPSEGRILVGGRDIVGLGLTNYRAIVGAVMQDDQLFAGSFAENIALGSEVDPQRVESAARLAAVHEDIAAMPMGYHSLIGDMGTALSGGQKQRVLLARALYRRPRILFLDEATSHLDVTRERRVSEAIAKLDLTRIIVAHRPETVGSADRILVMSGGRIVRELRPGRDAAAPAETAAA